MDGKVQGNGRVQMAAVNFITPSHHQNGRKGT